MDKEIIGVNRTTGETRRFATPRAAADYIDGEAGNVRLVLRGKAKSCRDWTFTWEEAHEVP